MMFKAGQGVFCVATNSLATVERFEALIRRSIHRRQANSPKFDAEPELIKKEPLGSKKKSVPKGATRHLLLIRHGQYNLEGTKDSERYLTQLGREQAKLLGQRLACLDLPYTKMISSTMTRAKETAKILSEYLPGVEVSADAVLEEGAPIPPEPPLTRWKPENSRFYQDGARIEAAFRQFFYRADANQEKDTYEIFVCHANVIRYFLCRALQVPPEAWLRFSLKHCSVTWVSISGSGRVTVRSISDAGFMSPDHITTC